MTQSALLATDGYRSAHTCTKSNVRLSNTYAYSSHTSKYNSNNPAKPTPKHSEANHSHISEEICNLKKEQPPISSDNSANAILCCVVWVSSACVRPRHFGACSRCVARRPAARAMMQKRNLQLLNVSHKQLKL